MKNSLISYVVQFTVTNLPHPYTHWRIALDLLVMPQMTAKEIMIELESRCISKVRERAKCEITGEQIMYSLISRLNSYHPE